MAAYRPGYGGMPTAQFRGRTGLLSQPNQGFFSGLLGSINKGLTNVRGRLAAADAGPRFEQIMRDLAISEQRIPATDLANRAAAQKYWAEADAARTAARKQTSFQQEMRGLQAQEAEREEMQRRVAERASPQNVATMQRTLLGTPLGASAFHGAMPSVAQPQPSRARDMAAFAPPSNVEQLLVAGGGGGISPFPGQAGPIAHQTPGYMNQDYIKNLLGPTTAESQAMAFDHRREIAKLMSESSDSNIRLAGLKALSGANLPAVPATMEWYKRQDPATQKLVLPMMEKALKEIDTGASKFLVSPTTAETAREFEVGLKPTEELSYVEAASVARETGIFKVRGTPGDEAIDKAYAPLHLEWQTERPDIIKGLNALKMVRDQLGRRDNAGNFVSAGNELTGVAYALKPRSILPLTPKGAKALNAMERVEEVVQRNLRAVLGGQFAEREGVQLIKRAYNIGLKEEYNFERLEALIKSVQAVYDSRNDTYEFYVKAQQASGSLGGTLRGWVPRTLRIKVPEGGTGWHLEGTDITAESGQLFDGRSILEDDKRRQEKFNIRDEGDYWIEDANKSLQGGEDSQDDVDALLEIFGGRS